MLFLRHKLQLQLLIVLASGKGTAKDLLFMKFLETRWVGPTCLAVILPLPKIIQKLFLVFGKLIDNSEYSAKNVVLNYQ